MPIMILDWDEIERLVLKTYSLGRNPQYEKVKPPEWLSQADVRRMSDALAYLMMGGKAPKLKQPLR